MLDPMADFGRRAWGKAVQCPSCADHVGCAECTAGKNCDTHWRYLLMGSGRALWLQCHSCLQRYRVVTPLSSAAT